MRGVQHMVLFTLHSAPDSAQTAAFLADGQRILTSIPTVHDFRVLCQISAKNPYTHGFSMVFNSETDYQFYSNHPAHQAFVAERWNTEVADFLEMDFPVDMPDVNR